MFRDTAYSVRVADIRRILEPSFAQGLSSALLLSSLELDPALLSNPDSSIDLNDCWRIMAAHQSLIQDETHLMSTRPLKRGTTQLVFSSFSRSQNLLDGLNAVAETYNIVHGGNYNFVKQREGMLSYIVEDSEFHYSDQRDDFAIEFALMKIHCAVTFMLGYRLRPTRLCTKRSKPCNFDHNHHLNFFDSDIRFAHSHYELAYGDQYASALFRTGAKLDLSAKLLHFHNLADTADHCSTVSDDLLNAVIFEIEQGRNQQAQVSDAMGMSIATLRRKLKARGTQFRSLLDQVHSEQALSELLDQTPPEVIAEKLGYSDVRSFKRAFRRWHGMSPAAFSRQHLPDSHS